MSWFLSACIISFPASFGGKFTFLLLVPPQCLDSIPISIDKFLQERGILGLASFLDRSECLTILWSSRYFSRIWCTFEVAAFLRNEQKRHIRIIPDAWWFRSDGCFPFFVYQITVCSQTAKEICKETCKIAWEFKCHEDEQLNFKSPRKKKYLCFLLGGFVLFWSWHPLQTRWLASA